MSELSYQQRAEVALPEMERHAQELRSAGFTVASDDLVSLAVGFRDVSKRAEAAERKAEEDFRTLESGFFDLVLIHEGTGLLILAEMKAGRNKPTADQARWLAAARLVAHQAPQTVMAAVWYWPTDHFEILNVLSAPWLLRDQPKEALDAALARIGVSPDRVIGGA